jgi:hypothetical protein
MGEEETNVHRDVAIYKQLQFLHWKALDVFILALSFWGSKTPPRETYTVNDVEKIHLNDVVKPDQISRKLCQRN